MDLQGGYDVIFLDIGEKTIKSWYFLNNFCVYVQNHIRKPIKRQKYKIISLVSTKLELKYFIMKKFGVV